MPLILNVDRWDRERSAEVLQGYRRSFEQLAEMFARPPPSLPNRWAAELAGSLCQESAALAALLVDIEGLSPTFTAAVVNQLYELQNAIPYLMKASQLPPPEFPSRKGAPSGPTP